METKDELIGKVRAISAAAEARETAREELFTKSLQLADAVLAHRGALREFAGLISGEIRAFIEADERYARAVNESIKANQCFSQCLYGLSSR